MSRRRHSPEAVAEATAWALHRVLSKLTWCPECGGVSTGLTDGIAHRETCEVARADRMAVEQRGQRASDEREQRVLALTRERTGMDPPSVFHQLRRRGDPEPQQP